jgi:hypothetical protein
MSSLSRIARAFVAARFHDPLGADLNLAAVARLDVDFPFTLMMWTFTPDLTA